jgi:hypothetical protein
MKIFDMPQGSTEWLSVRLGVVTSSEIDALVTPLWKARTGEGVETYLFRKLCEKMIGWRPEFAGTFEMNQGNIIETIALPWFNFTYDTNARRVGFCLSDDGRYGCSPDALLGDDNGLEIKSPQPPQHLKYLIRGEVPSEYLAQVHFSMLVTGRPKWTFLSFSRHFPALVVEVKRDERIQEILRGVLASFLARFDAELASLAKQKEAQDAPLKAAYEEKIRNWEKTGVIP